MKKVIRISGMFMTILVCVGGMALYVLIYHVLPYSPIRPHRCTREEIAQYLPHGSTPMDLGLTAERFDVAVEDSITLKGWFIHASTLNPHGTVILLHGSAGCKEGMFSRAARFSENGFNTIAFDLRAHGESGGMFCTFGYYEKRDVSRIVDEAIKRFHNVEPFGIYGNSLGGAIALQVLAVDPRIKCGVAESSFGTLREVIYDYMKRITGIPFRSVSDKVLEQSSRIARFPIDSVRPQESAKQIHQPVMIVHGTEDNYISIEYGKSIFQNLPSANKAWYPIEGGDHNNLLQLAGAAYEHVVIEFFRVHLKSHQ